MSDLFDRLDARRPIPVDEKTKQPDPTQKLLNFLLRWSKPIISERQIRLYVRPFQNRERVIKSTEILEQQGWLVRDQTCRHRQWRVVRRPIVHPIVDA
jgi:hypothetical protein